MIIGFANEKGGVGKTTLALHTATWLCTQGHRVVLMDLDTQGGVAHFLGLEPADHVAELFQSVLSLSANQRPPISTFLTPFPLAGYPNLALIKGDTETGQVEADLRRPDSLPPGSALVEVLAPLIKREAIIIIDTGPYAGRLQEAVLEAANHILVPAVPEGATEAGILKMARRLHRLGRAITGLIPTRVVVTSRKHQKTILDWKQTDGLGPLVYHDPPNGLVGLPQRVVWSQLYRATKPIWDVTPKEVEASSANLNKARQEMTTVLQRLVFDVGLRDAR